MRIDVLVTKNIKKFLDNTSFTEEEKQLISKLPRVFWQKQINKSNILFKGKKIKPGFQIEEEKDISFKWKLIKRNFNLIYSPKTLAYPMSLDIKYKDKDIIVVNKPTGISMHPAYPLKSVRKISLTDALLAHFPEVKNIGEKERPGIIHRLDKKTSGTILIGRNIKSFDYLKSLFRKRKIQKTYLALVEGKFPYKYFEISGYTGKNTGNPLKRDLKKYEIKEIKNIDLKNVSKEEKKEESIDLINPKWSKSIGEKIVFGDWEKIIKKSENKNIIKTWKKLLPKNSKYSLIKVYPITGRTHQIRVHLAKIGFPVLGDDLYGKTNDLPCYFLHALEIYFKDLKSKKRNFKSSNIILFRNNILTR